MTKDLNIYLFYLKHVMEKSLISFFSRTVGYRFGPHLGDTVPVLINYCKTATENDEELREYSLQVMYLLCYT